jgi:CRP-like cAMP-binding protein
LCEITETRNRETDAAGRNLPLSDRIYFFMHEHLEESLNKKVSLTTAEWESVKSFFIPKKLRKRQYVVNAGDVCQYFCFVEKGLLRSFSVDKNGNEHVVQFALEGWWISDMGSFLSGDSAVYNIEALENAELLLLTRQSMDDMLIQVPKMERYFRLLMQQNMVVLQRRILGTLSLSAEEKYRRMMLLYPDILQRSPQQYVASFLGITPETLSRVRKQVSTVK